MSEPEVFEVLRKIRYDLTAAQAKVTEALNMLARMDFPAEPDGIPCSSCGNSYPSERALALHRSNVHDGPAVPLEGAEVTG